MSWIYAIIMVLYLPIIIKKIVFGVTWKAFNPLWWFLNSDHPWAGRYKGEGFIGVVKWHLRNPLHNYFKYCIGVGERDTLIFTWTDGYIVENFPAPGLRLAWLWDIDAPLILLPCIQYRGKKIEWYIGWRANGAFGMALRAAGAN